MGIMVCSSFGYCRIYIINRRSHGSSTSSAVSSEFTAYACELRVGLGSNRGGHRVVAGFRGLGWFSRV